VLKEVGDQALLNMTTSGPFTAAAGIRGTDRFLRDLRKNPELVHRLLRLTTDSIIRFAGAAFGVGARIGLADPTSSGTMISSRHFRQFALPYLKEVVSAIVQTTGAPPSLHICGNTTKIWGEMADTGVTILSLDDAIDLAEARAQVGHRVALLGNIRPTAVMYLGSRKTCGPTPGIVWPKPGTRRKVTSSALVVAFPSIRLPRTSMRW